MSAAREETAGDPMRDAVSAASPTDLMREEAVASASLRDQTTPSLDPTHPPILEPVSATALAGFRRVAAALMLADAWCIVSALLVVHADGPQGIRFTRDFDFVLLTAPIVWISLFHSFGLYGVRHLSPPEELRRLISATILGVVVIVVGSVWWDEALDRSSLALMCVVALFFELVARRLARWHIRRQKRLGRLALRTLIAGTNEEAAMIAEALSSPSGGFVPIGFVTSAGSYATNPGLPLLGSLEDLEQLIRSRAVECVFVASTATSPNDVYRIFQSCRKADIEMRLSANAPEVLTSRVSIQQVQSLMMLAVRPVRLTGPQSVLKRSFDVAFASLSLALLLLPMAAIALAIKLTSRGPVMFRQERVTKGERPFTMYKFRTMVADQERALEGRLIDLTQPFFKMPHDPRLTRIGRSLRSLSLDELPQLWNVIRGDMSLVGPRPLPVEQVRANRDLLQPRHEVRAGLTGWWQVSGRSEVNVDEALKLDMFYIENWSLSLDVYVLLKTAAAVIARRGAY
jgi:exopolysaccharide biosynthesis polyprenyl glycosylphosphotransferase